MLSPNFTTTLWANFWPPCIWIRVSTTTGAPPGASWCPLWWVLLKKLNCRLLQTEKASCIDNISLKSIMLKYTYYYRVRASRQKEIEKQPIKIEKNPRIHMTTSWTKVLSCHSFSINLVLSPQQKFIKRIKNDYRNPSTIPCWNIPFSDAPREGVVRPTILSPFPAARHIATAFLVNTWQGNHVGW